ncbi:hypothetical protein CTI12_AA016450 (mitochondrion) [Artemisia annua]|uniref:Uncharacterized protein n=1 Tax=Artemisia annua TaxID=35608 RepID=A0A2U1QA59_ARTAN|nr:hypothetical protein CTI12_AA016450 [Artemisia annua]
MKGYPARNFNQSYGIVKSLIGGISSSTYRDNAKRRSRFQQQPVKTKYRSKDRDVPEVVSRKVSSVYAKAEEELVGNE